MLKLKEASVQKVGYTTYIQILYGSVLLLRLTNAYMYCHNYYVHVCVDGTESAQCGWEY
jgi:hypothetical protein